MIPTKEERARIRHTAQNPESQDSRHTYRWSPHGIRVHARTGAWEAFYALRHHEVEGDPPTRLVLTGLSYGDPPAEIAVHFVVLCEIVKYITGDYPEGHPEHAKYNLSPRRKDELAAAEARAVLLGLPPNPPRVT